MINRKGPAETRDVPVEFVVVGKKAQLTVRGVAEGVNVAAWREHHVGVAKVDALAVGITFHAKRLIGRIAGGREYLKVHDIAIAVRVLRHITIDVR